MDRFQYNNIRLVPILHNRMEFAQEVRRQFREFKPDRVAVEFPDTLGRKILQGVQRLPLLSVVYYKESNDAFVYLLIEPADGQIEAIRLALSNELPVHFIDRDTEGYLSDISPMPDSYAVARIGHFRFCNALMRAYSDEKKQIEDILREKTMAHHLQTLSRRGEKIFFVGGLSHVPGVLKMLEVPQTSVIGRRKRAGVGLAHLHEDSSREILSEMPYLSAAYENSRCDDRHLDRLLENARLLNAAEKNHRKNSREEVSPGQLKVLNKFARNYALLNGALVPDFYQLVIAARGAVDDNFAYEVWELGSEYPWQSRHPGLPVLRLRGEDLFLDQKHIQFHRRLKTMRRRLVPVPGKNRRRREWKREFNSNAICSYPPEDIVIEGYGRYLQKRAMEIKSEENAKIEPFTSSMGSGLDMRETLRSWLRRDRRIYIKEEFPLRGKAGSVVVIFDPDLPDRDDREAFPWRVTWLGEHSQESDMAFYSSPAGEIVDGPGISLCRYGGFMLTYPPMRVYDVWRDPFFEAARSKPELLLMAALDYSIEKNVVYVAADPPSGRCRSMAARLGRRIVYLPIGTFSPVTLKKIKQFHVLDGHHVREYAGRYIP